MQSIYLPFKKRFKATLNSCLKYLEKSMVKIAQIPKSALIVVDSVDWLRSDIKKSNENEKRNATQEFITF